MQDVENKDKSQINIADFCREHGIEAMREDHESGEYACGKCGYVSNVKIVSTDPERKIFSPEEFNERARTGPGVDYGRHDFGMGSYINEKSVRMAGKKDAAKRLDFYRLRKWQYRLTQQTAAQRNLSKALTLIEKLREDFHFPYIVREEASMIYRSALTNGLIIGRSIDHMATAAMYMSNRYNNNGRTLKEFAEKTGIRKNDLARSYRALFWGLQKTSNERLLPDSNVYVSRISNKLEIPVETRSRALQILKIAKEKGISSGKDPAGFAAAALYQACVTTGFKITQKSLAREGHVTEVTIRSRHKQIKKEIIENNSLKADQSEALKFNNQK